MPRPTHRNMRQKAVYWPNRGHSADGRRRVGERRELNVRWTEGRTESKDPQNNNITYDARVKVAQDLSIGGIMWLGDLGDLPNSQTFPDRDIFEIVDRRMTPDLKGRCIAYSYGLMRFTDTLPTVVE